MVIKTPDTMVIRPLRAMITVMQACRTLGNFLDVMPAAGAAWPMNRTRKTQSSFGLIIKKPKKKKSLRLDRSIQCFFFRRNFTLWWPKNKNPVAKCTKGNILGEKKHKIHAIFWSEKNSELDIFTQWPWRLLEPSRILKFFYFPV